MNWYHIGFYYNGYSYDGYVIETFVLVSGDLSQIPSESGQTGGGTAEPTPPPVPSEGSDYDFEAALAEFPESYHSYLEELHARYPNWQFKAYQTNLDWETVLDNESAAGKSLITNNKGIAWKSTEPEAYDWEADKFIAYDGSTWVMASREALAYYMDPRNFLTDTGIFQFEVLTYEPEYQNAAGVENILKYTPLYETVYSYVDESGVTQTLTYGETFIEAAAYSGVSPYHLASRVKQEVVTGTTTLSGSATGNFSGMEGYYNFYNIGAYASTAVNGALANGLKYSMNGSTDQELNLLSLIPWTSPYRAIVGGAYIIGNNYINKGQNTVYLQKFNVTPTSTYEHQYMTNVEAPSLESKKTALAYPDASSLPLVFSIPVYLNMPQENSPMPGTEYNPNNWLKSLTITDENGNALSMTPEFEAAADQEYYVEVGMEVTAIRIEAVTVSSKAAVTGDGYVELIEGANLVHVMVTAENGNVRTYPITIVRE